jgi:hypothetical protein
MVVGADKLKSRPTTAKEVMEKLALAESESGDNH